MGRYDGIVLCSDFDGTLAVHGEVSQKNCDAIKYFCDNGGVFSVISGRGIPFFADFEQSLCLRSYVGCVNGAVICHMPTKSIVDQEFLPDGAKERACRMLDLIGDNLKRVQLFTSESSYPFDSAQEFFDAADSLPWDSALKVIAWSHEPYSDEDMSRIGEIFGDEFLPTRSGKSLCEINAKLGSKGRAARKIAELCGAHTLVCVGDYENDISLLQAADIAYAVENAIPKLKQIADRITVCDRDDAIAAIIAEL